MLGVELIRGVVGEQGLSEKFPRYSLAVDLAWSWLDSRAALVSSFSSCAEALYISKIGHGVIAHFL
jgi:hypothetical protein